jgi:hypothetical protein
MKMLPLLSAIFFPMLALFGCASPPTDSPSGSSLSPTPVVSPAPAVKPQPMDVLKQMAAYLRSHRPLYGAG